MPRLVASTSVATIHFQFISLSSLVANTGESLGLVSRSGSWYSFKDERLGQGIGNSAQALEDDTKLADQLEAAIREKVDSAKAEEKQESKDVQAAEATEDTEK